MVDTQTAAYIAGAAGVLGALVGALGGGVADYFLEKRRAKRQAKAGARLLRSELQVASEQLSITEKDGQWRLWWDMSFSSWDDYRDAIALSLDPDGWGVVDQAVRMTRFLEQGKQRMDTYGQPTGMLMPMGETALKGFGPLRENLRLAYNALSGLADGTDAQAPFGEAAPSTAQPGTS
jgi:hypothetical protein